MSNQIFDAGIFIIMLIVGFTTLALYRKIGALLLAVSVLCFLVAGLIVVTGQDVAFTKLTIPSNVTSISTNNTSGKSTTTVMTKITAINETDYLIGNSEFQITGTGQLWMGWSFITLAVVCGVIFLDQTLKGRLVLGD